MSPESYSTFKALHIIFIVSWFAGLFYIIRLFIYHTEAQVKEEVAKKILTDQFEIMEKRLWWIITTPAMILAVLFGTIMLVGNPDLLKEPWMHLKLTFVAVLLFYHFFSQKIMFDMKKGKFSWKSNGLRIWNELATLCLVAVAFLVTMKDSMNWIKGTVGFFAVAIALMIGIKLYKRIRNNKK
ncbi:MAG: protoporphyrinogen oxidase HemJ [Crocinitomicaceae bacterium]|nr:protoporphyrinogen oxidase HemJ [Crocinitomicaceae bacterium]MDC1385079.1 protoporphyrinogen oxidase HemJ [Crocinitomicaceae bacterium]|tara:strand:- start:25666 stop:26214 length:549 start_codon:yes stop_codon:yes gene_type:complete